MVELFTNLHSHIMDPARIPLALAAMLVTVVIGMISGPVAGNANPLIWLVFDIFFGKAGDRLNRPHRRRSDLAFRGFMLSAIVLACALFMGKGYAALVALKPVSGLTEIMLLCTAISTGSIWFSLLRLYFALEKNQIGQGAYFAISRSTRINLSITDDFGVTRVGMTYAARSFDKGLVAPVFWYLVGGLPLAVIYAAAAAMAWRFGKDGFSKGFGSVPLAIERLLGFVPSLFAAFLITFSSTFTPQAGIVRSITSWLGHKNRAPYEQGSFPLSALAWALNVSLGGATQDLSGSAIPGVWVGPEGATARNSHKHLKRTIYINVTAHLLFVAVLLGAYVWAGKL